MNDSPEAASTVTAEPAAKKPAKGFLIGKLDAALYKRVARLIKKVINARSRNPITQHVRLRAEGGKLLIEATDLEACFTGPIGEATGSASVILLPEILVGLASFSYDGGKKILATAESGLTQEINHSHDPEDWPKLPERTKDFMTELRQPADFLDGLDACMECCASEKGRYALNGVLLEPSKGKLELCGTDGRRLNYASVWLQSDSKKSPKYQVILPTKVGRMLRMFAALDGGQSLWFGHTENRIDFTLGEFYLGSLLVEGQFPDYRSVIPKDLDCSAIIERETWIEALREVKKYTSIESQATRLTFLHDGLECRCKSPEKGMAFIKVPLQTVPAAVTIGLDPDYLIAALERFKGKWVAMEFHDHETGVIIHDGTKSKAYSLVMPINI